MEPKFRNIAIGNVVIFKDEICRVSMISEDVIKLTDHKGFSEVVHFDCREYYPFRDLKLSVKLLDELFTTKEEYEDETKWILNIYTEITYKKDNGFAFRRYGKPLFIEYVRELQNIYNMYREEDALVPLYEDLTKKILKRYYLE